jgi:hypothetical protein
LSNILENLLSNLYDESFELFKKSTKEGVFLTLGLDRTVEKTPEYEIHRKGISAARTQCWGSRSFPFLINVLSALK